MTKSELLNIVIKIFGLYYFVRFVQHLMEFLFMVIGNSTFDYGLETWFVYSGIFITTLVELAFAYVATLRTELIANRLSGGTEETLTLPTSKTDLIEIALAVISVLAIVYSIPSILAQIIDNIYFHNHQETEFWTRPTKKNLIQSTMTLVIGIFLLLNSRNFAKRIVNRGELDDKHEEQGE